LSVSIQSIGSPFRFELVGDAGRVGRMARPDRPRVRHLSTI
jgi:hypothetical protein